MLNALLAAALVVVSVADGDTLTIRDGDQRITVRLAEIDAPERTMPYSQVARRDLVRLCGEAKDVRYERIAPVAAPSRPRFTTTLNVVTGGPGWLRQSNSWQP